MATILFVEDDQLMVRLYRRALELEGYTLDFAGNGEEAMSKLASQSPPDLVLLDLRMPKIDGLDVLSWIRKQETLADLPVIVLTNLQDKEEESLKAGATLHLMKSEHSVDEVVASVRGLLE